MKISYPLLLLIILLGGCNKIEPATPSGCSDPQFITGNRFRTLKNIDTYVFAFSSTSPDSSKSTSYFIRNPDSNANLSQPYIPCNLPEEYKKNSLAIRFSGYAIYFPGDELRNSIGMPIELTSINAR